MDNQLPSNVGASTSALKLDRPPTLLAQADAPTASKHNQRTNTFFRDARVCPDGSCVLALAEDRSISLFMLPARDELGSVTEWQPAWTWNPPDSVLSFEWFPGASPDKRPYFAFVVAVKDHPVQLLDGADCRLRASYPIEDHQERFVAPHSMAFGTGGTQLYCGFDNAIEVFDVSCPGAPGTRIHTSPTRASKQGQKGIISSLAFRPDGSGLLAAGSFSGTIGLYDTTQKNALIKLKPSNKAGVSKVAFHPDSHLLFAASRLSTSIEVFDVRNFLRPAIKLPRQAKTNQKLGFDVDESGTWLVAGATDGSVAFFSAEYDEENVRPIAAFTAGQDPIGCVSFVPGTTLLITCAGTRRFDARLDLDTDSESEHDGSVKSRTECNPSLRLWQLQ